MLWFDVLAIATPVMVLTTSAAYYAGRRRERREMLPAADRAARYKLACRDVMTWCCEDDLKAARMTAHQIMACGEGEGLKAGTPLDDEPCTVNGLREQLRRMRQTPNGAGNRPAVGAPVERLVRPLVPKRKECDEAAADCARA